MKFRDIFILAITNPILLLRKFLNRIKYVYLFHIKKDFSKTDPTGWWRDKGDETLRLNYPSLNSNSIVFDLGGYEGDFAYKINNMYDCTVYLFEPHPLFYKKCVTRFKENPKVIPFNIGLSDEDGIFELSDSKDGSSFLHKKIGSGSSVKCQVREFFKVMEELKVSHIHLIKINIEGSEYQLLEHMAKKNMLHIVDDYQIQFHNFIDGAVERRDFIVNSLSESHHRTWCYEFVWENWEINSIR